MYGRIVESHEPTRQRAEYSQSETMKIKLQAQGFTSTTHYNLVLKFVTMPRAMKISDASAAEDKEWKNLQTIPAWNLEKVKSKKEVILEAQRDKKKVLFAALMDKCHFKNAELEPNLEKYNGSVVCQGRLWRLRSPH